MLLFDLKRDIHQECMKIVDEKLETLRTEFRLYQESAANETKSTAGDKHDTGKAMMQMEQEKLGKQLNELLSSKSILSSINLKDTFRVVSSGSLVETNHGIFYISVSLGKILVSQKEIFAVSIHSPLAQLMQGKQKNSNISFNGRRYDILDIC